MGKKVTGMASLRKIASILREDAQDGIAWFILWKKGRSWNALEVWPEAMDSDGTTVTLKSDDAAEARRILAEDPDAAFVNSWYHNLGMFEDEYLTVEVLAEKLRWQYEDCGQLLSDWEIVEANREPDADKESGEAQPENEQIQEPADDGAYLLLQATNPEHSTEYRIMLLDKAAALIADYRETIVRELAGLDGCGGAPPDV